jgi:hypothetical protein
MRKDLRLSAAAMRDHAVFAPATALASQVLEALVNSAGAGWTAPPWGRWWRSCRAQAGRLKDTLSFSPPFGGSPVRRAFT